MLAFGFEGEYVIFTEGWRSKWLFVATGFGKYSEERSKDGEARSQEVDEEDYCHGVQPSAATMGLENERSFVIVLPEEED